MNSNLIKSPLVSIIVPSFNHANYISDCICSIALQDYRNIELIIIDDGSKDDSVLRIEEMRNFCERRFVRFEFRSRVNLGLSATMNEALAWCEGEFVAPIASDDMLFRRKTSLQVSHMQRFPDCAAVFGTTEIIRESEIGRKGAVRPFRSYKFSDIFLHKHNLPASTQMIRSRVLREIGGYKNGVIIEDWTMWLAIAKRGHSLHNIGEPLALYRLHGSNISNQLTLMATERKNVARIYSEHSLYKRSIANCLMIDALENLEHNRAESIRLYLCALKDSPIDLFSSKSVRFIKSLILSN